MKKQKTYLNWSSGKDASLALYYLLQDKNYEVALLLTSVNTHYDRVTMHGLRRALLEKQIASIGIRAKTIELPEAPSMEVYESKMKEQLEQLRSEEFTVSAFGDIFLEDLRSYREAQLKEMDLQACFPIWKRDTKELLLEFIDLGFKAIIVCINAKYLDASFVGRTIDRAFLEDLPSNVDPCGENGEFHSFCYDGPIFSTPIEFSIGEKVFREYKSPKQADDGEVPKESSTGFWFCDLLPKGKK